MKFFATIAGEVREPTLDLTPDQRKRQMKQMVREAVQRLDSIGEVQIEGIVDITIDMPDASQ